MTVRAHEPSESRLCDQTMSNLFERFEYQRKQRGTVSIYMHDGEIL